MPCVSSSGHRRYFWRRPGTDATENRFPRPCALLSHPNPTLGAPIMSQGAIRHCWGKLAHRVVANPVLHLVHLTSQRSHTFLCYKVMPGVHGRRARAARLKCAERRYTENSNLVELSPRREPDTPALALPVGRVFFRKPPFALWQQALSTAQGEKVF